MTFREVSVGTAVDIVTNRLSFGEALLGGVAAELMDSLLRPGLVLIFPREASKPGWRLIERTVKPG